MELSFTQIERLKAYFSTEIILIYSHNGRINIEKGILKSIGLNAISVANEGLYKDVRSFRVTGENRLLHIYNNKSIDLLYARQAESLAVMMRNGDILRSIIKNIRNNFKREVFIVHRVNDNWVVSHGEPLDMGIKKLKIRLAAPADDVVELPYQDILHIYNDKIEDILVKDSQ